MSAWRQWARQPQTLWLRRVTFQVHLWTGLAIGLYIVVLSTTGSIMVYRVELVRALATPRPLFDAARPRRSTAELRASAEHAYPGYAITYISEAFSRRDPTIEIRLEKNGEKKQRLFNPYTGEDLGDSFTSGESFVLWVAHLHDELLLGPRGRVWNGIGSTALTVLALTGAIVWWPGISKWRRSLAPRPKTSWPRFCWELHSALGLWCLAFLLMWGVSGSYLGIPDPFIVANEYIFGLPDIETTPGDRFLEWLARLHFGRWRNGWLQAIWAIAGLVPVLLFVTATVMWWNRVVRKTLRSKAAAGSPEL